MIDLLVEIVGGYVSLQKNKKNNNFNYFVIANFFRLLDKYCF